MVLRPIFAQPSRHALRRTRRVAGQHLDLWQATHDQLVRAGVPSAQTISRRCARSITRRCFHRFAATGKRAGRLVRAIRSERDTTL